MIHQHRLLVRQIRDTANTAWHKNASPDTIDMAITTALHKKKLLSDVRVLYLFQFSKATLGLEIMPIPLAHKGQQGRPLECGGTAVGAFVAVLAGNPVACFFRTDY